MLNVDDRFGAGDAISGWIERVIVCRFNSTGLATDKFP
jgi:hypothetical protein